MTTPLTSKKYQPVNYYFIADPSYWPMIGSLGLFSTVLGFVQILHQGWMGKYILALGAVLLLTTTVGWFGRVIRESVQGLHSKQMDKTYRWGMMWFIVSEISLFAVFFLALFYTRLFTLPTMSGEPFAFAKALMLAGNSQTHSILWPHFKLAWPLLTNPNPQLFPGPHQVIPTWGIPAINTVLLLSSAVTVTWAHWGIKKGKQLQTNLGLLLTIILGLIFVSFQAHEYILALTEYNLTLKTGIYANTFFALTGLHAMHVSLGAIMLIVILIRSLKGHFTPDHHFAFEAVSWYWHFVDVVWLVLFTFVYWI
jgi:cytochrome c oxidase subunit III